MLRKVLVANRGEIAVRIIRGLKEAGIPSVAVYSDVDRAALHVQMADEAVHIGPAASSESYLCIEKILAAARQTGADAIHPGYGFLSENAEFAAACDQVGIIFIGPSAESIRQMGSKTQARKLAIKAGVPVVPGTDQGITIPARASAFAEEIGYPVMIKAAAGGGGKGMRRVDNPADLHSALRDASSEAERAFKSGEVYIEKYIEHPRHVEIQVLGDRHGNLIHLGERECSIQRRHQKVIEESPSPVMCEDPELRYRMGEAAVQAAAAAGYYSAGTVEFLVDEDRNFYFLEMNTRLQVEHPVTELVTGLDLVQWQLKIAAGEHLTLQQEDINWRGAAIECRIYAEDPENQFMPSPGRIAAFSAPAGPGVRFDGGVYEGWTVPMDYDPMLAKVAVWAETRELAIVRMIRALEELTVGGIRNNINFFRRILVDPQFRAGKLHTGFIDDFLARTSGKVPDVEDATMIAALVALVAEASSEKPKVESVAQGSHWVAAGRRRLQR